MLFATEIGGTKTESGNAIAVDGSGNIYIVGQTDSTDFPLLGAFQGASGGPPDAFVVKLNSSGTALVYSTYLGGSDVDTAQGVAVANGNAYVGGVTRSSGLSGTSSLIGTEDAFVASFNSNGTQLQYFTYIGGSGGLQTTDADAIAVDTSGVAYITGKTTVTDLPSKQNSLQNPMQDAFITKINTNGAVAFSTYLGGTTPGPGGLDADEGISIAVNGGNIFVTGVASTTDFPVVNALTGSSTLKGKTDAFVTEFSASGATPAFSMYFGGTAREDNLLIPGPALGGAIAVDSSGNIYITGSTNSSDLPLQNPFQGTFASSGNCGGIPCPDAFVAKITP
jgi:hypothetical protein